MQNNRHFVAISDHTLYNTVHMNDFLVIVRRNLVSPIVIAILVLASIMLILGEPRDAWFLSVVILANTLIAIVQEVRAKRALKKLELMNMPYASRILANGKIEKVLFDKLKLGDLIKLQLGDEAPADGEVVKSEGLETDESIMTGETTSIEKPKKSIVYAASSVVAGSAVMRVTTVGSNTKVGHMTATLKRYKPQLTPMQRSIARAITWLTYGALALAGLIYTIYYLSGENYITIFKTITTAAVTVVPEGLLLASSLLLAYGSIRLAQAKVLPQKLAAIEAMALLNVMCVDKTGTLTSDKIKFENFELFDDSVENIEKLIGIVAKETDSGSSTGKAVIAEFKAPVKYKILQILAFSSERKMSGVKVSYNKQTYNILMGAPEYISFFTNLSPAQEKQIESLTRIGKRVLLIALFDDISTSLKFLKNNSGRAVGVIVLSNELREGVEKTVNYLQKNDVSIRVISGDNPNTVSYISRMAGITDYQKIITGSELAKVHKKDWDKTITNTTVFARVLPEQKERLVETFTRLGNFTGMVGDGVNDAMALKKSDLGVAMYSGAVATRRVADIVLLDDSFNSLPMGMRLGNKIIQAIELIATLFFHKIIYGVVLLIFTLVLGLVYPFAPRHITFMNIFLVTLPTIMWTLFPPSPRHRLSPKYFWRDTLFAVAPISILSGLAVTITYVSLRIMHPDDISGVATTTVIIATLFGVYLVFLVPRMFDVIKNRKTRLARLTYLVAAISMVLISFGFGLVRDFFDFTTPAWQNTWPLLLMIVLTMWLQWIFAKNASKRFKKHSL